jgi:chromosome partitioning protein
MSKKMMKYAVFNYKGGVGKSTIAVHIAHGLALDGFKVLLVDMDGQNDASLFLGFTSQDYKKTFYDLIVGRNKTRLEECLLHARDNLDLLPSNPIDMINTELFRVSRIDLVLEEKLKDVESFGYDFVIIDCGPQRSKVNDAVLCYADGLIIPVQLQAASVRAVGNIYEYLSDMKLNTDRIKLIVPNMYDQRTNDSKENLALLTEFVSDDHLLTEPIHRRVKIAEAGKLGKTVFEYDDESAQQFLNIVKKVISRDAREEQ